MESNQCCYTIDSLSQDILAKEISGKSYSEYIVTKFGYSTSHLSLLQKTTLDCFAEKMKEMKVDGLMRVYCYPSSKFPPMVEISFSFPNSYFGCTIQPRLLRVDPFINHKIADLVDEVIAEVGAQNFVYHLTERGETKSAKMEIDGIVSFFYEAIRRFNDTMKRIYEKTKL